MQIKEEFRYMLILISFAVFQFNQLPSQRKYNHQLNIQIQVTYFNLFI